MAAKHELAVMDYSYEHDVFFVRPANRDYSSSLQIGNFILDLDSKNQIRGVEILSASKLFNIEKIQLSQIQELEIKIDVLNNVIHLRIALKYKLRNGLMPAVVDIERISPESIKNSTMALAIASA